ncbi:MAG: MFS transporter [Steroidobacteraceae bacterium]
MSGIVGWAGFGLSDKAVHAIMAAADSKEMPMDADPGSTTTRKLVARLVPFAMLLFFVQMMDKTNVGFAALQMNQDLAFTPQVYGFGAGVFFLGAFLFEIPSNLVLARVGARRWLARIMITWGFIVIGLAATHSAGYFYLMRFLLGVAEAGLLPGILYYLHTWMPEQKRGMASSALMSTSAIGAIVAGPLATGLMQLRGVLGLNGWQWIFVAEGIATVLIGALTYWYLPDTYAEARFLSGTERRWLADTMHREALVKREVGVTSFMAGFFDKRVLVAVAVSFLLVLCNFGTVFWLPQIIKSFGGLSDMQVGWLSVLPYACGGAGMIWWGRHSDRRGERRWHLVLSAVVAAVGYSWAGLAPSSTLSFLGICLGTAAIMSMFGVFWAHAGDLLGGAAAAGGLALLNTASQLGGFLGPVIMGVVRKQTQSFSAGLLVLGGCALLMALIAAAMRNQSLARRDVSSHALV